jgi:CheY-like chemotaxis protein
MSPKNVPTVLLVEASTDDVDFARRALARSGRAMRLVVAERGEDALAMLRPPEGGTAGAAVVPALVLLDLNISGTSGRELLAIIKSDPLLLAIPVVVLSTSSHRSDVEFCYRTGANSYHSKPDDFDRYQKLLAQIVEYWLEAVVPDSGSGEATADQGAQAG